MHLPTELAEAIAREAARHDRSALMKAVAAISNRYQEARPTGRLTDVERAAYLAVRMPATWAALRVVFDELRTRLGDASPQSMLDLGAGPGTTIWAAAESFPNLDEITCVEHNPDFIALGKALAPRQARWIEGDVRSTPFPPADFVVLSYAAGELDAPNALIHRAWAAARLALVMVEPGTPRGFATIRAARDSLIQAGAAIAAPCPHAAACPMKDPDWCHFAARLERTRLHRQLKGGDLGHEDEKFSYVIASRTPVQPAEARIVRHPWTEPGLVRLELCGPSGLRTLVVRKRDASAFRQARKSHWGGEWREIS